MPDKFCDHKICSDVIAIRIDAARAVAEFTDQLRQQAEEGEAMAPANPGNRALFRALAPFRLVEYDYIAPEIGPIIGAFVGFPDGGMYRCDEIIPEEAINADLAVLAPLCIYIVLDQPAPEDAIAHYLAALSAHLGQKLEAAATLDKAQVLDRHNRRNHLPDGRAYAQITHNFRHHTLEFPSIAERDTFVAWSHDVCARGLAEFDLERPAESCAVPPPGFRVIPATSPVGEDAGGYWRSLMAVIERVIAAELAAVARR
jgi:hypothetical protein